MKKHKLKYVAKLNRKKIFINLTLVIGLIVTLEISLKYLQTQTNLSSKAWLPWQHSPKYNKVILFIWDGAQKNHVQELLNENKLPNLQKIITDGEYRDIFVNTQKCEQENDGDNYRPETGPAFAAMLTGYGYPTSNNQNNGNPQLIPQGYTVFERIKKARPEVKTAMITGKGIYFFPLSPLGNTIPNTYNYTTYCCTWSSGERIMKGAANPSYPLLLNTYLLGLDEVNEWVSNFSVSDELNREKNTPPAILKYLNENYNSPFFLFAEVKDPDWTGHRYGENSNEYSSKIIENDKILGQIIDLLKQKDIYSKTVILVTADHGFYEGQTNHSCLPNDTEKIAHLSEIKDLWLASNRKYTISNPNSEPKQTSITPTILSLFGIIEKFQPDFYGEPLNGIAHPTSTPTPSVNTCQDASCQIDCTKLTANRDLSSLKVGDNVLFNLTATGTAPITTVEVTVYDGKDCSNYLNKYNPMAVNGPGTYNISWIPTKTGPFVAYGRVWNDGISECRSDCIDHTPRFLCPSAISCKLTGKVTSDTFSFPNR